MNSDTDLLLRTVIASLSKIKSEFELLRADLSQQRALLNTIIENQETAKELPDSSQNPD